MISLGLRFGSAVRGAVQMMQRLVEIINRVYTAAILPLI